MSERKLEKDRIENDGAERSAESWQRRYGAYVLAGGMLLMLVLAIVTAMLTS